MINKEEKANQENYSAKMSFFLHQDNLFWSRLQTLGIIQISVLGSSFGLKSCKIISLLILILGIILSLLLFFLLKRDELIKDELSNELNLDYGVNRRWYAPLKGREITWFLITILLAADFAFGFYII